MRPTYSAGRAIWSRQWVAEDVSDKLRLPGTFIVVDGPDGAGKTTLAAAIVSKLREVGHNVVEVREPGGTRAAEAAREVVLNPECQAGDRAELFLYLAARADLVEKVILPALAESKVVVSDRFDLSTIAYQVHGRGLPESEVRAANKLATGGLEPNITLILDVPLDVGKARLERADKAPDRLEGASDEMHRRVRESFKSAAGQGIFHVDATVEQESVCEAAWEIIGRMLPLEIKPNGDR